MNTTLVSDNRQIEETIQMAEAAFRAGDFRTAERQLIAALDRRPQRADLLLLLGHTYMERQEYESGLACYNDVAALCPNSAPVESSRALALQLLGRSAEARAAAERAFNFSATDEVALKVLIRINLNEGNAVAARPLCARLMGLNATDEQARQMMAECEKICNESGSKSPAVASLDVEPLAVSAPEISIPVAQPEKKEDANWEEEISFWDKELSLTGQFVDDMTKRVREPEKIFPPEVIPYLKELRQKRGRIPRGLDVGSGPLPYLSWGHISGMMDLVGADPLAEVYLQLIAKHGHKPTAKLVACGGEELVKVFGTEAFDFIYMRNALDHSQSPREVIRQMVQALRPGGYIYIMGTVKEATRQNWAGLHQHNLFLAPGGRLMDEHKTPNGNGLVTDCISDSYGLETVTSSEPSTVSGEWMSVIWRKPDNTVTEETGWDHEIEFWDKELSLKGNFAEDISSRINEPAKVFPTEIVRHLDELKKRLNRLPRVLDVGSGPLSYLSHGHHSRMMDLVAADPLASVYLGLMEKHGIKPTSPLVKCAGEEIANLFGSESFDFIFMRNALDHSQSPREVIRQMVHALRPGGYVYIQGYINEANRQNWAGLHQHNLFLSADDQLMDQRKVDKTGPLITECLNEGLGLEVVKSYQRISGSDGSFTIVWRKLESSGDTKTT